jgi:GntR family transcriptional repressor for pyruvate dehydrogenase complex
MERRCSPIRKLTYETVYDEIKRRIEDGLWPPGSRIPPLDHISEELGVGISSVREAIRILGKQNILRIEQGRGTFVQPISLHAPGEQLAQLENASLRQLLAQLENASLWQLLEARLLIEPKLAELAAVHASQEEGTELLRNAAAMNEKVLRGEEFLEEDLAFHELIAKASRHTVLSGMLRMTGDLLLDSRRRSMKWPGMHGKAAAYHTLIAHAVARHEAEQAERLMRSHIEDMMNAFQTQEDQQ